MSQLVKGFIPSGFGKRFSSWPAYWWPDSDTSKNPVALSDNEISTIWSILEHRIATESATFSPGAFDPTFWRGFECTVTGEPEIVPPPELIPLRLLKVDNTLWPKRRSVNDVIVADYAIGHAIVSYELGQEMIVNVPRYDYRVLRTHQIGYNATGNSVSAGWVDIPGFGRVQGGSLQLWFDSSTIRSGISPQSLGFSSKGIGETLIGLSSLQIDPTLVTEVTARANQGDLDLLTFYAELPETLRSFYDLLKRIVRICSDWKNREFRMFNTLSRKIQQGRKIKYVTVNGMQVASEVAALRLRYRYEIEPLVYSLVDLARHFDTPIRSFKTTKKRLVESVRDFGYSGWTTKSGEFLFTKRAWCKRAYALDESTQFSRAFMQDIAVTAYELVPGSFILDWFLNFGQLLTASGLFSAVDYAKQGFTYSMKVEGECVLRPVGTELGKGPQVRIKLESYERKVINPREHLCVIPENGLFGHIRRELDLLAFAWISFASRYDPLVKPTISIRK